MLTLGQPTSPSGLHALLFHKTRVSYLRAAVLNFLEGRGHFAPPSRRHLEFLETFLAVTGGGAATGS